MRRIVSVVVFTLFGSFLLAVPAQAAWEAPAPALNTPTYISTFVNESGILAPFPIGDPWAPSGTKIRSSGFTPADGLNFLNYSNLTTGTPNEVNTFYLGVPDKNPVNLRDADVLQLLGKKACVGGKLPCTLTLAAQEWKRGANAGMAGGHCWGIATTVAQIFNGVLPLSVIGHGKSVFKTPWSNKMTRQIARAWASQDAIDIEEYSVSPRTAVQMLKHHLRRGSVPYTIGIRSTSGDRHGVTPVALYRTGPNLYKIAIYDNNYPGRIRAMQVDTAKNEYQYEMFTIPGAPPTMADGMMQLVPLSVLDAKLPCPFCGGSIPAQVQVAPVPTQDDVTVGVADWDGNAIKGLVHHHPTDPSGIVGIRPFGKFEVPKGKNFALTIDATKLTTTVTTEARVIDSGVMFLVSQLVLTPGSIVTVYVNPKQGFATVKSTKETSFNVTGIDVTGGQEWSFEYGTLTLGAGGEATVTVNDEQFISTFSFAGVPTQHLQVLARAGTHVMLSAEYAQGSGGVTLAQYKQWNSVKKGALKLSVSASKDASYVPIAYGPLLQSTQ